MPNVTNNKCPNCGGKLQCVGESLSICVDENKQQCAWRGEQPTMPIPRGEVQVPFGD
jgi:hypothetical protein